MFIDEASIIVSAGNGGHGCIAFRREKFVAKGGPNGGNGGSGGDILLVSTTQENTLLKFRYEKHFRAARGRHGEGSDRHGKSAKNLVVTVPVGTLVYDDATGALLQDLKNNNQTWMAALGGRGGKGNAHFASSRNRAPKKAQDGEVGEKKILRLELKLLADVGLVGFPNAGKSTLIASISAARPKIADYPFTTLEPNLGVVETDDFKTFVMADIPGLIEGAHQGHGLGLQFLRHIERTRLLLYLIDVSGNNKSDPVSQLSVLRRELEKHNPMLVKKSETVVASKMDSMEREKLETLEQWCRHQNIELVKISSISGKGLDDLKQVVVRKLTSTDETGGP